MRMVASRHIFIVCHRRTISYSNGKRIIDIDPIYAIDGVVPRCHHHMTSAVRPAPRKREGADAAYLVVRSSAKFGPHRRPRQGRIACCFERKTKFIKLRPPSFIALGRTRICAAIRAAKPYICLRALLNGFAEITHYHLPACRPAPISLLLRIERHF